MIGMRTGCPYSSMPRKIGSKMDSEVTASLRSVVTEQVDRVRAAGELVEQVDRRLERFTGQGAVHEYVDLVEVQPFGAESSEVRVGDAPARLLQSQAQAGDVS